MIVTAKGYRVYFPGDEVPLGEVVMSRKGDVLKVMHSGYRVRELQPDPLIGIPLPHFENEWTEAYARNKLREDEQERAS